MTREYAVIEPNVQRSTATVAAIVTICTNQKRLPPTSEGTPAALPFAPQADVASRWLWQISAAFPTTPATKLYAGRAFALARDAAAQTGAKLFVVSAGLGLVAGSTAVPGYSLTVARGDTDSIRNRVIDAFDPPEWFRRLLASPYSAQWSDAFSSVNGRVLFAVTKPYAEMASQSLAAVPASALSRLRIFGAGLGGVLPAVLKPFLLPYDDRLDTIFPGTRSDFAQRALVHFSRNIAPQDGDISLDAEWVRRAMAKSKSPLRPVRSTATDEALLAVIRSRLHPRASASQLLRRLRDDDQIACEQGRFAKLFRQAQSEGDCS